MLRVLPREARTLVAAADLAHTRVAATSLFRPLLVVDHPDRRPWKVVGNARPLQ